MQRPQRYQRIWEQVEQLRILDPNKVVHGSTTHKYLFAPTVDEAELLAFEVSHGVKLPEGYRDFLKYVGNGGAGPDYGLFSLAEAHEESKWITLGPLNHHFLFSENWGDDDEEEDEDEVDEFWDHLHDGCLLLSHHGCASFWLLIVTGAEPGLVWFDSTSNGGGMTSEKLDFLEWYEAWLERSLARVCPIKR